MLSECANESQPACALILGDRKHDSRGQADPGSAERAGRRDGLACAAADAQGKRGVLCNRTRVNAQWAVLLAWLRRAFTEDALAQWCALSSAEAHSAKRCLSAMGLTIAGQCYRTKRCNSKRTAVLCSE